MIDAPDFPASAFAPPEPRVDRAFGNVLSDMHSLLFYLRRGDRPDLGDLPETLPRLLREAATRLEGGVW